MRITCLLTVCACLSSTVFADELKHLNRITRGNLRDELAFEEVTTRKELNFTPRIYSDIFTLQKPQSLVRDEVFRDEIPKTIYEFQSKPQQFQQQKPQQPQQKQHYHYNRGRPREPKRLKTRSIIGTSTFELNDNHVISKDLLPGSEVHEVHEVHEEKPIRIEPVLRVTKKTVLDSIVDIVKQLLHPSKNEPGPIVGPIKIPGSGRKIFLRLLEPLDQSHVVVRFVTQMKIPAADLSEPTGPLIPPVIDPVSVLLHSHGKTHLLSDTVYSSSNRHAVRNNLGKGVKGPTQSTETNTLNSVKDLPKNPLATSTISNDELSVNETEDDKNSFSNAQPNLGNQFPGSYYHYQSVDEAVKEVDAILNDTTNGASKPLEPWYQLTTHHLPLKQIAPLYSLTSLGHDTSSQTDTYKVPSDSLTGPSSFSGSYEQYNSAPGSYAGSYEQHHDAPSSYSASYDKPNDVNPTVNTYSVPFPKQNEFNNAPNPYTTSHQNQNEFSNGLSSYATSHQKQNEFSNGLSSYATSHQKQNEFSNGLSSYATSHQNQNEFSNGLSSYATSHQNQNEFSNGLSSYATSHQNQNKFNNGLSSYSTSYGEQSDLYSAPSSYSSSYERPAVIPSMLGSYATSYNEQNNDQTGLESQEALRVIDPPSYLPNQSNHTFERGRQFRHNSYNSYNLNGMSSSTKQRGESTNDPVVWGKTKREKNQSSFENSPDIFSNVDDDRKKWEPSTFFQGNANWQNAFKAGNELREARQQPKKSLRNVASTERGTANQRPNGKRRSAATTTRTPKCLNKDGCEQAKPTTTIPTLHSTVKIAEKAQEIVNVESIAVKSTTSSSVETPRLDVTKSLATLSSMVSSTTEKPSMLIKIENSVATEISLPLIKATKSPVTGSTERLIAREALDRQAVSKTKAKSAVSSTTENISLNSAKKVPNNTAKTLQIPKRPMVMKKPSFIIKRVEASGTTKKTTKKTTSSTMQKSTTSSTTKKPIRTKYQGMKKKSSTI